MIQFGAYTTFCQGEGILLQKYRDRNGRCIAILSKVSEPEVDLTLPIEAFPDQEKVLSVQQDIHQYAPRPRGLVSASPL